MTTPLVALVYNLRRIDSHASDEEAEFDKPSTVDAIARAIEAAGTRVVKIEADAALPQRLVEARPALVFNVAEGKSGRTRESQVPAICEFLDIPCTGSDSTAVAIAHDKAVCKLVLLAQNIPTPAFAVVSAAGAPLPERPPLPWFVKPLHEGTSKGVDGASLVRDRAAGRRKVDELIERYRQPALVEELMPGRELTVGVLERSGGELHCLPPVEVAGCAAYTFAEKAADVTRFDVTPGVRHGLPGAATVKLETETGARYECPAPISPELVRRVHDLACAAFRAVGCRDLARVDIRCDARGEPKVLEVNPLAGLVPDFSDLCVGARADGMSHEALVGHIVERGLARAGSVKHGE